MKELLNNKKYFFLKKENFFINHPICYLTLAGSYAYGTNNENSDIDIRGFFLDDKNELLTLENIKEEFIDSQTDTVIYSFRKFIKLLINCNPNILELLGTNNEHILLVNKIGSLIRDNYSLFLSKKAYDTFIGYASSQLKRLEKIDKITPIKNFLSLRNDYNVHIYEENEDLKININVNNVSLKPFISFIKDMDNCYKINHRNRKKDDSHLFKHAMHLIRLYLMGIDVLKEQKINTYRHKEHKLLLDIRQGKMTMEEIFHLQNDLQKEIDLAYKYTQLPEKVNLDKINKLILYVYNLSKNDF